MPFLAPVGAAIVGGLSGGAGLGAGLAKVGIGLGGSLLGSKLAGGTPRNAQTALDIQNEAMRSGMDLSKGLVPQGQNLLDLSGKTFNPVVDYWANILSGNRGAMTSVLAPEIQRIGEGYRTAANTSAALNPRGGPSASYLADLPFQQQRDVSSLMQTMRPAAASGLLETGRTISSTGSNIISNAINALYGSTTAGRGILDYQLRKTEQDRSLGRDIGRGIFELLKGVNFGGGGGGPTGPGYSSPGGSRPAMGV